MLTKNLLRFRRASGYLKPRFIEASDDTLLNLASSLIQIYDVEQQPSRADIEEQVRPLVNAHPDITLAKGLNKLILDRCEFAHDGGADLSELRDEVFSVSSQFLETLANADYSEAATVDSLYQFVDKKVDSFSSSEEKNLYGDLPEFEKLVKLKSISPKLLLERYNVSLVQSLLINSSSMTIIIREPSTAKLRRLFKYLKFFGLLASIYLEDSGKRAFERINKVTKNGAVSSKIRIEIDGPLSLFENSSKYGLRLASFFPAVCDMSKWQLKTNVKIDSKNYKLSLDEQTGLSSVYRNFSAYVPDEIKVFHKVFAEKVDDWEVGGDTPFLKIKGQEIVFPDLCFTKKDGDRVVFLELFHRWHTWQLKQRLNSLLEHENVIVGVDRSLYKKTEVKELVDSCGAFESKVFLFSDFPSWSAVKRILNKEC